MTGAVVALTVLWGLWAAAVAALVLLTGPARPHPVSAGAQGVLLALWIPLGAGLTAWVTAAGFAVWPVLAWLAWLAVSGARVIGRLTRRPAPPAAPAADRWDGTW